MKWNSPFYWKVLELTLSNVIQSSRLIFLIENLFCSIWPKILTDFSMMQMESVPGSSDLEKSVSQGVCLHAGQNIQDL